MGLSKIELNTKGEVNMAELKDSGGVREFGTGAHRDAAEGKGRCDLLPLEAVDLLLKKDITKLHSGETLKWLGEFIETDNVDCIIAALGCFILESDTTKETALLEVSKQYEDGANKYGANNWKHGMPLHVFLDSASRHYLKWRRGDEDEPHHRGVIWNLLGAVWTYKYLPNMNDVSVKK